LFVAADSLQIELIKVKNASLCCGSKSALLATLLARSYAMLERNLRAQTDLCFLFLYHNTLNYFQLYSGCTYVLRTLYVRRVN
jgi:hypothetical protein